MLVDFLAQLHAEAVPLPSASFNKISSSVEPTFKSAQINRRGKVSQAPLGLESPGKAKTVAARTSHPHWCSKHNLSQKAITTFHILLLKGKRQKRKKRRITIQRQIEEVW